MCPHSEQLQQPGRWLVHQRATDGVVVPIGAEQAPGEQQSQRLRTVAWQRRRAVGPGLRIEDDWGSKHIFHAAIRALPRADNKRGTPVITPPRPVNENLREAAPFFPFSSFP